MNEWSRGQYIMVGGMAQTAFIAIWRVKKMKRSWVGGLPVPNARELPLSLPTPKGAQTHHPGNHTLAHPSLGSFSIHTTASADSNLWVNFKEKLAIMEFEFYAQASEAKLPTRQNSFNILLEPPLPDH